MAVLPGLVYPHEQLQRVAAPVVNFDTELARFLADFEETMHANPGCVALAAPQVGRPQRIAIVDVSGRPKTQNNGCLVLINPEMLMSEGAAVGREGCLSVPDYTGNVARATRVRVRAQDARGAYREYDCTGFEARAVQHEIDHLDGLLFLDRLVSSRDLFTRKVYQT
jgi:peptide deformylase